MSHHERIVKFLDRFEKKGKLMSLFVCNYCEGEPAFDRKPEETEINCPYCGSPMTPIMHQNYDFTKRRGVVKR